MKGFAKSSDIESFRKNLIETSEVAELDPFPEGWYFFAERAEIQKAQLFHRSWMGNKVIAWIDTQDNMCVARSTCPHLGSALSPDVGGRVRNGRLVCPFHGFEYDTTGQCVATPSAPPPKSARLSVFEVRESNGMVFAWSGKDGRESHWKLPADQLDEDDWSSMRIRTIRFRGHPQETTENSVDMAHLSTVHGYSDIQPVGELVVEGAYLRSCWKFRRQKLLFQPIKTTIEFSVTTHIYGLGYSFIEACEHSVGMDSRLWVLVTPIDGTEIEMKIAIQTRSLRKPKRALVGLRFLPTKLRTELMNHAIMYNVGVEIMEDVAIWESKKYRPLPRLTRDEDMILTYRRYCDQFYSDDRESPS